MLSWLIERRIDAFERSFDYDMAYTRELFAQAPRAFFKWIKAAEIGNYREDVPKEVWFAARLVALLPEDCGPCTQLLVTMAEREGVSPELLQGVLSRSYDTLPRPVALAVRFAEATLRRDAEADMLREQLVELFGKRGLISLALGITASRLYPTLKYALGYGHSCRRVVVGGQTLDKVTAVMPTEQVASPQFDVTVAPSRGEAA